ncbi:hypothetical protein WJX75_003814 [Coccomyxa subellipsoidea]|uniref:F-box domain-containing protein n=1 Tax=Coccomyxa subellipsoidea TaxID=248742 RepID=A0ABR2YDV1_9CHLO
MSSNEETPHKHIPEEVWQLVARHLNIKEWAQASGTCKATWTLQLSTTVITSIKWLVKRTQHLHALRWTYPTAAATEALLESVIENPVQSRHSAPSGS